MNNIEYLAAFQSAIKLLGITNILIEFHGFRKDSFFYVDLNCDFNEITKDLYLDVYSRYKKMEINFSDDCLGRGVFGRTTTYISMCSIWIRNISTKESIKDSIFHECRHFWQWLQGEEFRNTRVAYLDRTYEVDARLFAEYASYTKQTLLAIAKDKGIKGVSRLTKKDLIGKLLGSYQPTDRTK